MVASFGKIRRVKGFTLLEVLMALFVFTILMTAVSQIFVSAFSGYRDGRMVQRDLENAQFAMNSMAKMLRTSSIVSSTASSVKFYDYSQLLCVEYAISGSSLTMASQNTPTFANCQTASLPAARSLTAGSVSGSFRVISSQGGGSKRVGRVTVSLELSQGPRHVAKIQSSTSLRDYNLVGF